MQRIVAIAAALLASGCAALSGSPDEDDYLKWVAFQIEPDGPEVLMRWPEEKMPLRVHLPPPPADLYEDPEGSREVVRDAILAWTDVAGPGLPRFEFVEDAADSDIPVIWAAEPDGSWVPREGGGNYIARCLYDPSTYTRKRLGIRGIFVMTQWRDGHVTYLRLLYQTLLHEMGHALGIAGHSPEPADIMYPAIQMSRKPVLSPRDRNTLRRLYALPIGAPVPGSPRAN